MENKKGLKRDKDINVVRETEKEWQTEKETKRERTKMNDDASGEQQRRLKKDMGKQKQKFDTKKGDRMGVCISIVRK